MIVKPIARGIIMLGGLLALYNANASGIPPHIADRVTSMAQVASGGEINVISISRLPQYPGLDQGTKIVYRDSMGLIRELIMLPDGEHFIPAGVMSYSPVTDATPRQAAPALSAQRNGNAAKPILFTQNDILGVEDFAPEVVSDLFETPADAAEVYFGIIADAPGVVDGTGGIPYYVMFDPACPYCLRKYHALRPIIDAGKITVHWIPVVGPSQPPYANLQILADQALDNQTRLGHLKAMANQIPVSQNVGDPEAAMKVLAKTGMVRQMLRSNKDPKRTAGTPQAFYRLPDGRIRHHYGYIEDHIAQLSADVGHE